MPLPAGPGNAQRRYGPSSAIIRNYRHYPRPKPVWARPCAHGSKPICKRRSRLWSKWQKQPRKPKNKLVARQREERAALQKRQDIRRDKEQRKRMDRFNKGLRGLWDRLTGRHGQLRREMEREFLLLRLRDKLEEQTLLDHHLRESMKLNHWGRQQYQTVSSLRQELRTDHSYYASAHRHRRHSTREQYAKEQQKRTQQSKQDQTYKEEHIRGPTFEH